MSILTIYNKVPFSTYILQFLSGSVYRLLGIYTTPTADRDL